MSIAKRTLIALLAVAPAGLAAQNGGGAVAAVPFGPGERAVYDVTLGMFGKVGQGVMEVAPRLATVHGHDTYHLSLKIKGGIPFARVDDTLESWLDVGGLFARRFHKDQDEVAYERNAWYDFFPDSMLYKRMYKDAQSRLATPEPLDEVSFLYFVRTLPLEVGKTYTFNRYFKVSGNPVTLKVLRREMMKASDGSELPVIVVQPVIQTSGLFGEGGKAEVYFTDDSRRILVKLTSEVPMFPGRLGLTLTSYEAGTPLQRRGR